MVPLTPKSWSLGISNNVLPPAAGFLSKLTSEKDLEVLSSVSEVTGYVAIVSDDDFFTSLQFLR